MYFHPSLIVLPNLKQLQHERPSHLVIVHMITSICYQMHSVCTFLSTALPPSFDNLWQLNLKWCFTSQVLKTQRFSRRSAWFPNFGCQRPYLFHKLDRDRPLTLDTCVSRPIIILYSKLFCEQCRKSLSDLFILRFTCIYFHHSIPNFVLVTHRLTYFSHDKDNFSTRTPI